MRSLEQWFDEYSKSHQHPGNKLIHYFCVPLITYSTLGIVDALSKGPYLNLPFSLAYLIVAFCGVFYLRLNFKLGLLLIFSTLLMVFSFQIYPGAQLQLLIQIAIFLVSWFFQFVGHKYEAAKPSFLKDLTFLLIGPLWIADRAFSSKLR